MSDVNAAISAENDGVNAASGDADLEGRARRMGWRPKEEFRGDQSRWTDAKSFIERGEAELPVLRERYRTLDDRFAKMQTASEAQNAQLQAVSKRAEEMHDVLVEFRERSKKAEEISYARARSDLEQRMAVAVDQADKAGYDRAKGELDRINDAERAARAPAVKPVVETKPEPEKPAPQTPDPVIEQWVSENPWFKVDQGMAGYATARFQQLRAERPGVGIRDHLDEVRADVLSRFPEKFENKKRTEAAAVAAPGAPDTAKRGKIPSYENWPADAKEGYQKFKRMMPDYKPEEYAAIYFAGEQS